MPTKVEYVTTLNEALYQADMAFIVTEWDEIKELSIKVYEDLMKKPILFDGRNCYPLHLIEQYSIEYHSIGRPTIKNLTLEVMYQG